MDTSSGDNVAVGVGGGDGDSTGELDSLDNSFILCNDFFIFRK
jgi:hypothetical protein